MDLLVCVRGDYLPMFGMFIFVQFYFRKMSWSSFCLCTFCFVCLIIVYSHCKQMCSTLNLRLLSCSFMTHVLHDSLKIAHIFSVLDEFLVIGRSIT